MLLPSCDIKCIKIPDYPIGSCLLPFPAPEALRHAELILFTEEPAALAAIEQHDRRYARQLSPPGSCPADSGGGGAAAGQLDIVTAGTGSPGRHLSAAGQQLARTSPLPVLQPRVKLGLSGRPLTSALPPPAASPPAAAPSLHSSGTSNPGSRGASSSGTPAAAAGGGGGVLHCRELALVLLQSWGDSHFTGLSGLAVLGADRQALRLGADALAADPPDLNVFPGHSGERLGRYAMRGNGCSAWPHHTCPSLPPPQATCARWTSWSTAPPTPWMVRQRTGLGHA